MIEPSCTETETILISKTDSMSQYHNPAWALFKLYSCNGSSHTDATINSGEKLLKDGQKALYTNDNVFMCESFSFS